MILQYESQKPIHGYIDKVKVNVSKQSNKKE